MITLSVQDSMGFYDRGRKDFIRLKHVTSHIS